MGPRKRARLNLAAEPSTSTASLPTTMPSRLRAGSSAASTTSGSGKGTPLPSQPEDAESVGGGNNGTSAVSQPNGSAQVGSRLPSVMSNLGTPKADAKVRKTQSWYGSWPRKSLASTQVARETILGGTSKPEGTADFSRFETKKNPDAMSIDEPAAPLSNAPLPNIAETESPALKDDERMPRESADTYKIAVLSEPPAGGNGQEMDRSQAQDKAMDDANKAKVDAPSAGVQGQRPSTATGTGSGWLSWFKPSEPHPSSLDKPLETSAKEPEPLKATEQPVVPDTANPQPEIAPATKPAQPNTSEANSGGSWFSFWPKGSPAPPQPHIAEDPAAPKTQVQEQEDVVMQDAPAAEVATDVPAEAAPKAGSTWAFWSRENGSKTNLSTKSKGESGQLAVIGESSETHPKRTISMEIKDTPPPKEPPLKSARKDDLTKLSTSPSKEPVPKKGKRGRPQSMEIDEPVRPSTPSAESPARAESSAKPMTPKTPTVSAKPSAPNLLLPSFKNTYRMKENPSILKQIAQILLRTESPPANHVFLNKERPKVKKAIALGVHGLFPANYLRPMIGQPTGTSMKFANHCAEAIRRWANSNGCEECEIEKVALEGEGKIGERVENLWKLLLNWIDHIRRADLIIIACHSQGVPVAMMLLAKLIEFGIVTGAKIGVCAMAGVSLGPFPEYRSGMGMLMGSANELWEFANPESEISQRLEVAVKAVLKYGARITYVGSIDDQLVPMESAIYSPAHHPYIYRSVFIDGRIHAPDFIAHLVGFALKLRNLGVSDQGLVRELSMPLAGSLYGGEGHSRLYDDNQVYDLAVVHTLETTDVDNVTCEIHKHEGLTNPNPYHLPWIMRGLLEQDFVKTELSAETAELLKQFDDWKPVNKALKDVKYRLEAVRSKL